MQDNDLRQFLLRAYRSAYEQRHPARLRPYLEAFLGVAAVWCALALLQRLAGLMAPGSPYLLVIVAISLRWGLRVGLFSSVIAVLAEALSLPAIAAQPTAAIPHAMAHFVIYAAVPLAVGVLASFYRRERVRAERAAQHEREAAEYQRRMVGILAHDLKAPITAVRGYVELALRHNRHGQPERADAAMTVALQQIDRLTNMITSLVEASRIEQQALVVEAVSLAPALDRLVTAFGSDALHPLLVEGDDQGLGVLADALALDRILDNLLSNAVKYSPEGGAIRVVIDHADDPSRVRIRVADRGIGVPPNEREKIFAPYYRGSNQRFAAGTGVGLYICRELARKMGGALTYAPNSGGGSVLQLELMAAGTAVKRLTAAVPTNDASPVTAGAAGSSDQ